MVVVVVVVECRWSARVRHFSFVMSFRTLVLTTAPSPSHGPLPLPGQPNWIQMERMKPSVSCWFDHQWRLPDDLKCVALSECPTHAQNCSWSRSARN